MDGNHKVELSLFWKQTNTGVQLLQQCPLTQHEAMVVYLQCCIPSLSYPLPAN